MIMQSGTVVYHAVVSRAVLVAALLVVLAACSVAAERLAEDALEAELGGMVDIQDGTYTVTDETGTVRVSDQLPPGLEVPVLNGATQITSMERRTSDGLAQVVDLQYPVARYDEIIEFYEAYAASLDQPVSHELSSDTLTATWITDPPDRIFVGVELTPDAVFVKVGTGL